MTAGMSVEEDGHFDGLNEDDLIDDAEVDTMVREAVTQVRKAATEFAPVESCAQGSMSPAQPSFRPASLIL